MADRTLLIDRLARQRARTVAWAEGLSGDDLVRPVTPSETDDGDPWSAFDHLAHLLRIERAFLTMAQSTLAGDEAPVKLPGRTFEEKLRAVHEANEVHLADQRGRTLDDVLGDLADARASTIAFIESITDEQLDTPMPGAPWGDGTIAGVLGANGLHERQHIAWVDEAAGGTEA